MKNLKLNNKLVGDGYPCYIVAEIGGLFKNLEEAKRLIDSAIEIGIDAVKFQTFEAETITTKKNLFNMEATGKISQYDIFKQFELSKDLQMEVVQYANKRGITIFSAPSHMKDLEIIKKMDLPIYKIGSDLACHIPLLKKVAKLNRPMILSTGMCTLKEVRNSVNAIIDSGNDQIALMHCVSNYPSKAEEVNLRAITTMKEEFDMPVGMSDHTIGTTTTLASVVIGANLIERHFRDIKNSPSPDDIHSLTKDQFHSLIQSIRDFEKARGNGEKLPTESEMKNLETNRVSIIIMKDVPKGTVIEEDMVDIRRPGVGIQPIHYEEIIGRKTKCDIKKEEPLYWSMLE